MSENLSNNEIENNKHHDSHDCCNHEHHHDSHDCCNHEHHHSHDEGCECCHHHDEDEEDISVTIKKIVASAIITLIGIIVPRLMTVTENAELIIFLVAYLIVAYSVIKETIEAIKDKDFLNEDFLMLIASLGAFLTGEYIEAVAVMLFFQVGEVFEDRATEKSRQSIAALMDIRPDFAWLKKGNDFIKVEPDNVKPGDVVQIKPGERVPLDGIVINGTSSLNEQQLTGESMPRDIKSGDEIISGAVNITGLLEVKVTKSYGDSTVSKILDMVEHAQSKKAKTENFITKFARYYTPAVVGLAAVVAVVPSIITGDWSTWVYRGLTYLVVSCPCAIVISVPLAFFAGIGASSTNGILVKGSNYIEALSKLDTVVFDKTGTLTKGIFQVKKALPAPGYSEQELIRLAAYGECYSPHPIAKSLRECYGSEINEDIVTNPTEIPGKGLKVEIDGKTYYIGNAALMEEKQIAYNPNDEIGTIVYIAAQSDYVGSIVIGDTIKEDAKSSVKALKSLGISRIVMLTGDNEKTAVSIAADMGITDVHAKLLPQDKVGRVEKLLSSKRANSTLAFVGDGMNDAPVLARADVGIAMGAMGSDAAIEAADVVIMDDKLSHLKTGVKISNKTMRIVLENIYGSIGIKVFIMICATLGIANMWWGIFGDVGVLILAVLNAMRALRYKE